MAILTIYNCDRCGRETKYPKRLRIPEGSIKRDLCTECVEALRDFLANRPSKEHIVVYEVQERELEEVYRQCAVALEHYASGASPGDMAQHIRDIAGHARREEIEARISAVA